MATSYATLATRSSASPCDVVSTTAMRSPASAIARSVACSSGASGVVACTAWSSVRPPIARRDRADHAGPEPGGLEGRNGEIGRRRLAVGAGDADDRQLVRRIAVPPRGGTGQRRSRRGDHELRRGDPGDRPLDDHARRACLDRRRHEVVAVDVLPRDGHVEHPRPNLARIVGHAGHVDAAQIGRGNRPAVATRAAQPVLRREAPHQPLEPTPLGLAGHR